MVLIHVKGKIMTSQTVLGGVHPSCNMEGQFGLISDGINHLLQLHLCALSIALTSSALLSDPPSTLLSLLSQIPTSDRCTPVPPPSPSPFPTSNAFPGLADRLFAVLSPPHPHLPKHCAPSSLVTWCQCKSPSTGEPPCMISALPALHRTGHITGVSRRLAG